MFIQYFELNLHGVCVYLHKLLSYQLHLTDQKLWLWILEGRYNLMKPSCNESLNN